MINTLLSPLEVNTFYREFFDKKHLRLPSKCSPPLTSEQVLAWLSFDALWTKDRLKLARNATLLDPRAYFSENGFACPRKVKSFMEKGASLVLNDVLPLSPVLQKISVVFAQSLQALVQANLYYSPPNAQGFGSHFDVHDVWVIQCEGEKIWRLYENREDRPINHPRFQSLSQAYHDTRKGSLKEEFSLTPGDQLYLPRGIYHDARTTGSPSLHVTFSITRPIGLDVISLLFDTLVEDSFFRASLPLFYEASWEERIFSRIQGCFSSESFQEKLKKRFWGSPEETFMYQVTPSLRLEEIEGDFCLCSSNAYVPVPEKYCEPLRFVLDRKHLTTHDLFTIQDLIVSEKIEKFMTDLIKMGVLIPLSQKSAV